MEEIIATFLGLVPVLYLLGRLYSEIRGRDRSGLIDLDQVKENVRKSNGLWEWVVPIAVSLAFIYNILATAAWFVGELIQLGIQVAKWLFNNIFLTGPWFLLRMAWHYLVIWPWKLLRMAFGEILPSLTRGQFMTACMGILLSLGIFFLGILDSEGPEWLKYITSVLSIAPLGWAVGKIGIESNGGSYSASTRNNYIKHLAFLIGLFVVVTAAEGLLINFGTRTSMSSTLSQLFMFGTFWGSALLLFNAVLLLFGISALPFISADFNGSNKELLTAVWNHLRSKGLRYLVAVPMMALPLFILGIIPTLLTEGINDITKTITNEVYSERVESMEIEQPGQLDLYNPEVSEDSIAAYINDWKDYYSATVNKRAVEVDGNAISAILDPNSDETAAIPYYGLFGLIDTLNRAQMNILSANKTAIGTSDLTEEAQFAVDGTSGRAEEAVKYLERANEGLAGAKAYANAVCNPSDEVENENPAEDEVIEDLEAPVTGDPKEVTQCDIANDRVKMAENAVAEAEKVKARADFVLAQAQSLQAHVDGLSDSSSWSVKIAWVLACLFMAFLFALQFGFPFVLFARVNARIYGEDDDNSIVIMDSIRTMQSSDKNQPLLGLGVTLLLYLMYTGGSLLSVNLPELPNPIRSSIDYGVDIYDDVLGLDLEAIASDLSIEESEMLEETTEEVAADEAYEAVEEAAAEEVYEEVADEPTYGYIDEDGDGNAEYFLCINGRRIPVQYVMDGDCDCGDEYCEDEN